MALMLHRGLTVAARRPTRHWVGCAPRVRGRRASGSAIRQRALPVDARRLKVDSGEPYTWYTGGVYETRGKLPIVESRADVAYRRIYKLILRSRPDDETVWFERKLGEQLDMGRTPIREALKRLQSEGLLIPVSAHGGLGVARISSEDVESVYRVRAALESLAAELAAERSRSGELSRVQLMELADRAQRVKVCVDTGDNDGATEANSQFHEYITQLAANSYLDEALERLWSRISLSALSNLVDDRDWAREIDSHHRQLVQFISDGDAEGAAKVARQHIYRAAEIYRIHHGLGAKENVR